MLDQDSLHSLEESDVERLLDKTSAGKKIKARLVPHLLDCGRLIISEREAQAVAPYTVSDMRHIVHSGVMALRLFRYDTRLSKKPTFEDHLAPAACGVIARAGRTEKHVVAQGHHHDDKEDKKERAGKFNDFERLWQATFGNRGDPLLDASRPFVRRVWRGIGVLSKPPKPDRPSGKSPQYLKRQRETRAGEVHRKLMGAIYDFGTEPIDVKLYGDRWSNTETAAYQSPENQMSDALETYDFCRLGYLLGNREFAPQLADLALSILSRNMGSNGSLYTSYHLLREERMKESLDTTNECRRTSLRDYLQLYLRPKADDVGHEDILRYEISPAPLAQRSLQFDDPITELNLSDISISSREPLYEVKVIVRPGKDSEFGSNIDAVSRYLRKHFAEPGERVDEHRDPPEQLPQRGVQLTIYSRRWGLIRFRVNDSVSEARSKRGVTPVTETGHDELQETPPRIRAAAKLILDRTRHDPRLVMPCARELLVRPHITNYTYKKREPRMLPMGATIFDFADTVHPDFLVGYQCAIIHVSADQWYVWKDPYAPLPDGVEIEVISAIDEATRGDLSRATARPKWRYFCATDPAITSMRKNYFRISQTGDGMDIVERGKAEARYMAKLFGIEWEALMLEVEAEMGGMAPSPDYTRNVERRFSEGLADRQKAYLGIGAAEIDLLRIARNMLLKKDDQSDGRGNKREPREFYVRVQVPNKAGEFKRVLDRFEALGINLEDMAALPRERTQPYIFYLRFRSKQSEASITPMMLMLLKLSDNYKVRLAEEEGRKVFEAHEPVREQLLRALGL